MAFAIHTVEGGRIPAFKYLPAGAITPKLGLALVESSGNLVLATGTTKPTHICMIEGSAALTAGDIIPVVDVMPDMIFETTFSASASSIKKGDRVTLASNGAQVTATKTHGVATIVAGDGGASGAKCLVRFEADAATYSG